MNSVSKANFNLSAVVVRPDGTRLPVGVVAGSNKSDVKYNKPLLEALQKEADLEKRISASVDATVINRLKNKLVKMQDKHTKKFKEEMKDGS